jgi:hypothetical protein
MVSSKYILTKKGEISFSIYEDFEKSFHQNSTLIGFRERIGSFGLQEERFSHVYDMNNTAMILKKHYNKKKENLYLVGDGKNFQDIENEIKSKGFSLEEISRD